MDRLCDELVHDGGDGGVQHKRDQEQEPEHADYGQGTQEQGSVVLDLLQSRRRLLRLPHGGVDLRHLCVVCVVLTVWWCVF